MEKMYPGEERLLLRPGPGSEPSQELVGRFWRLPLADHEKRRLVLGPQIVVVSLEALIEVVAAIENERRNKRVRRVAGVVQPLGECDGILPERVGAVVANTGRWRDESGED